MEVENAVADENAVITVSHQGFVKRIPMHLYRRRVSSGKTLAGMERFETDYLERVFGAARRLVARLHGERASALPSCSRGTGGGRASRGQSVLRADPS